MNTDNATAQPVQVTTSDEKISSPTPRPEVPPQTTPLTMSGALAVAIFSSTFVGSLVGIVGCMVACRDISVGLLIAFAYDTCIHGFDRSAAQSLLSVLLLALRTAAFGGFILGGFLGVLVGLVLTWRYLVHGKGRTSGKERLDPDVKAATSRFAAERSTYSGVQPFIHIAVATSSTPIGIAVLRWWFDGPIDVVNADPLRFTTVAFVGSVVGEAFALVIRKTQKRVQLSGDDALSVTPSPKPSTDPSSKV